MKAEQLALLALAVAVYALASRPSAQIAATPPPDEGSWWDGVVEWWM